MANFLNKVRLSNALQTRNTFDLSHINLTTQGFYNVKPVFCKELMPTEKINVNYSQFCRLLPLEEPMMAHCNVVSRAFFVPYRVVWPSFNSFIEGSHEEKIHTFPKHVPYITGSDLVQIFTQSVSPADFALTTKVNDPSPLNKYDFYIQNGASSFIGYKFTPNGRRVYDILLNLGYSWNFQSSSEDFGSTQRFSALPLLAYCRVFYDWLRNSNYDNFSSLVQYFNLTDEYHLQYFQIIQILQLCLHTCYRTDLFTSAFDHPTGPNNHGTLDVTMELLPMASGGAPESVSISSNFDYTPALNPSTNRFTQNGLYMLHALTDYYQRFRLAGSRLLDRYFAEWGVKLSNEKLQRSVYLGGADKEISVLDVMDTSSSGLGDYAGKGIGDLNGSVSYNTDEFGQMIILSYIEPRTSTVQGYDRQNLHLNRFDFFSGDFDGIGYQAISKGEVFCDFKGRNPTSLDTPVVRDFAPSGVFGYSNRYYEYKVAHDRLTGDFRCPSINGTYDRWHLFRMIANGNDITESDVKELQHNLNFTVPSRPELFNRVFGNNIAVDPFFCRWSFNVKSSMPAKPLYEQYEFANHGQSEVVNLGGTRVTS